MNGLGRWGLGLLGSVLAHVGVLGAWAALSAKSQGAGPSASLPASFTATRVRLWGGSAVAPLSVASVAKKRAPTSVVQGSDPTRPAKEEEGGGVSGDGIAAVGASPQVGEGSGGASGREGVDMAALHARLSTSARRCYPAAARRFRLEGVVPVAFCLDPGGALRSVELRGSTGASVLDRAARECVVQGALPLEGAGSCFLVDVRFGN